MKKQKTMVILSLVCLLIGTFPISTMAEDNTEVSLETLEAENAELLDKIETLEADNAELQKKNKDLEEENKKLKEQIEQLQNTEDENNEEPEYSTEVIGTVYTDSSIVRAVQNALNDAGFDCGAPDGKAGSKTAEAIKAFEKEYKINVNGVITDELIEALGIADEIAEAAEKEAKMKEYENEYTYTQIARDPDSFAGKKMKFKGKVLQEGDAGSGLRYARLAVNSNYDTVLFVTYLDSIVDMRILDDDIITVYGECLGDYTYETVMNAEVTLPWLNADIIDMSEVSTS